METGKSSAIAVKSNISSISEIRNHSLIRRSLVSPYMFHQPFWPDIRASARTRAKRYPNDLTIAVATSCLNCLVVDEAAPIPGDCSGLPGAAWFLSFRGT